MHLAFNWKTVVVNLVFACAGYLFAAVTVEFNQIRNDTLQHLPLTPVQVGSLSRHSQLVHRIAERHQARLGKLLALIQAPPRTIEEVSAAVTDTRAGLIQVGVDVTELAGFPVPEHGAAAIVHRQLGAVLRNEIALTSSFIRALGSPATLPSNHDLATHLNELVTEQKLFARAAQEHAEQMNDLKEWLDNMSAQEDLRMESLVMRTVVALLIAFGGIMALVIAEVREWRHSKQLQEPRVKLTDV